MQPIQIQYRITLKDQTKEVIDLQLHPETLSVINRSAQDLPSWTQLDYHQCPHCPLDIDQYPHCPVAVGLVDIVNRFNNIASYDEVDVEVITPDRTMTRSTTSQKAVSSLFGLLIAASDCPHTTFLKPMARFHLPLATQDETIYRVTGMYLLAQYFLQREGGSADWSLDGLRLLYDNLHKVNIEIASRLRHWTEDDSSVNAIVVLDVFANILPFAVEDELERLENLFSPYLTSFYRNNISEKLKKKERPDA